MTKSANMIDAICAGLSVSGVSAPEAASPQAKLSHAEAEIKVSAAALLVEFLGLAEADQLCPALRHSAGGCDLANASWDNCEPALNRVEVTMKQIAKFQAAHKKDTLRSRGHIFEADRAALDRGQLGGKAINALFRQIATAPFPDVTSTHKNISAEVSYLYFKDSFADAWTLLIDNQNYVRQSASLALQAATLLELVGFGTDQDKNRVRHAAETLPTAQYLQYRETFELLSLGDLTAILKTRSLADPNAVSKLMRLLVRRLPLDREVSQADRQKMCRLMGLMNPTPSGKEQDIIAAAIEAGFNGRSPRNDLDMNALEARYSEPDALELLDRSVVVSDRAKKILKAAESHEGGLLMLGSHAPRFGMMWYLPNVVAHRYGLAVTNLVARSTGPGDALRKRVGDALQAMGATLSVLERKSLSKADQVTDAVAALGRGKSIDIDFDGLTAPGEKAATPWMLRPYYVKIYPLFLALSKGAKVAVRVTRFDEDMVPRFDLDEVTAPPNQGSLEVRATWFAQRAARKLLAAHKENQSIIVPKWLESYGGRSLHRDLQPFDDWSNSDAVKTASIAFLADTNDYEDAVVVGSERLSLRGVREFSLRMASLFLHFQSNKPEHFQQQKAFLDLHRVLLILPKGMVNICASAGAVAAQSFMCVVENDIPPAALAARVLEFDPDLVISTASSWTAVMPLLDRAKRFEVLICDDAGGINAITELVDGFEVPDALPRFDAATPGFLIFTSGSTGAPKGAVMPYGTLEKGKNLYALSCALSGERYYYIIRWDCPGILDFFCGLSMGARIMTPDAGTQAESYALAEWLIAEKISVMSAPTTKWRSLVYGRGFDSAKPDTLRMIGYWGEPVSKSVVKKVRETFPKAEQSLNYGATESEFYAAYAAIEPSEEDTWDGSPGGRLLPDVSMELIDAEGVVQGGKIRRGRPKISGRRVTFGYMRDLRKENPRLGQSSTRVFTGGDIIVWDTDTTKIEIFGREDAEVNLAAKRYSLLEIEQTVDGIDGITDVAAFVTRQDETPSIMLAIECALSETERLRKAINVKIRAEIGDVAQPKKMIFLPKFKKMPSEKLDRTALRTLLENSATVGEKVDQGAPEGLSKLTYAIGQWALDRGLIETWGALDAEIPTFTSLEIMELILTGEDILDRPINTRVFRSTQAMSWGAFARQMETEL